MSRIPVDVAAVGFAFPTHSWTKSDLLIWSIESLVVDFLGLLQIMRLSNKTARSSCKDELRDP